MHPPRVLATLLLTAACVVAAPASAGALVIGIGDQTPDMFNSPRFLALNIKAARLSVAWDVFDNGAQARALSVWLRAAKADGVSPLISFDHHYPSSRGQSAPSAGALGHEFRIFRARYPWVHDFATWNEANYCGQPTCHRPALVARYYRALRQACRSCTILGAELLDEPGMLTWVRAFDRALGGQPGIWGLHNYLGANRLQIGSTESLLKATRSEIWFTETGGVVARHNASQTGFPQSPTHAAAVTGYIFNRLARLSPRITRVYLYQWNAGPGLRSWDSGLLGPEPTFTPRPAFATLVRIIAAAAHSPLTSATTDALLQAKASLIVGGLFGSGGPAAPGASPVAGTAQLRDPRTGAIVASETVGAGQRFAFAVVPGRYTLTAVRTGRSVVAVGPAAASSGDPASGGPCADASVAVANGRSAVANAACSAGG